jgi:hypothetical protein
VGTFKNKSHLTNSYIKVSQIKIANSLNSFRAWFLQGHWLHLLAKAQSYRRRGRVMHLQGLWVVAITVVGYQHHCCCFHCCR